MPEEKKYAHTNGFAANGHCGHGGISPETSDGEMFLFTSESVGEGHPGTNKSPIVTDLYPFSCCVRLTASTDGV